MKHSRNLANRFCHAGSEPGRYRKTSWIKAILIGSVCVTGLLGNAVAATTPAQSPLYSVVPGAKPNLMFVLDNSGSMSFESPDDYSVSDSCKDGVGNGGCSTNASYTVCKSGYSTSTPLSNPPTGLEGRTIPVRYSYRTWWGGTAYDYGCQESDGDWVTQSNSAEVVWVATPTAKYGWYAMRSYDVNPQYYNPAITYLPRVNADGTAQTNREAFVSNQDSQTFSYNLNPTYNYNITRSSYLPTYVTYTTANAGAAPAFSYVKCGDAACSTHTATSVTYSGTGTVTLPTGHKRTDCGTNATTCTNALEVKNILNWYDWYRTRMAAVTTATGQAMQPYENKIRVGYGSFNMFNGRNPVQATAISSGVRYFKNGVGASNQWKSDLYTWLYGLIAAGGTPSHNAIQLTAGYYGGTGSNRGNFGNPWKNDPTSTSAESATDDLSCRRAYTIVMSDGAWNSGTSSGANTQYASVNGTSNFSGTPNGNAAALQYNPNGATGYNSTNTTTKLLARSQYVPYGDGQISQYGLADLTANYYWNTDFSSLPNNVPPIPGQHNPAFWQNMTTYTIGWNLTPSGDSGVAGGLTWSQINQYTNDWLSGNTATKPKWADSLTSVNLNSVGSDQYRVNDFIRAGYTGGGRAFSVYSGDDVRQAIDTILSSAVGTGKDAGVAVSGNSGQFQSLDGQTKYTTEYNTADNTGDLKAYELDSNGGYKTLSGGVPVPLWSADQKMPAVTGRKIFSLSGYDANSPNTAASLRQELNYNTKLSTVPSDFSALLNSDGLQKTDETFIRYMLGQDGLTNTLNAPYRIRNQPIAASVNSPPAFVGGRINMGYDTYGSVNGQATYASYRTQKQTLPATIFSATNEGKVHVINGAATDTAVTVAGVNVPAGAELASFMPKNAMSEQISLADPAFRFRYILDGPLVDADVYDSGNKTPAGSTPAWRQLVFGTGGRATRNFMFGLESPLNTSDRVPTKNNFLWEADSSTTGYGDLAKISNNPTAGQLDDGTWVMLTGSGHYGGAGKQVGLYVVNAFNGKLVKFIPLPSSYNNTATTMVNRGLGGVVAVRDTNRNIVAAYAGDANGNLWRFDLRTAHLVVSYNKPLFTTPAGSGQPIYATPAWQAHPGDGATCSYSATSQCGTIVVVGTGIVLDADDLATPATQQAIYGIWDPTPVGGSDVATFTTISSSQLVEQTINLSSIVNGSGIETGKTFYTVSSNSVNWTTKKGWMLKLGVITYAGAMTNGERVVGDLSNIGSSVLVTSVLPAAQDLSIESCTSTGSLPNINYVVDALTGGNKRSFDYNADGTFDAYSIQALPSGGFTRGNVSSRNMIGLPNEGQVELKPQTTCTNEIAFQTGVEGTNKIADACPTSWRRSWRPIVNPPF